ncbi:MAG: hypothetical protein KTR14_08775 [Vampirovibrio sp.]|nr:hypothetical protein [Vampirovibrio sp.]
MAKAINWPQVYRNEVLGEDEQGIHAAFRLGSLYYEHQFWVAGEVVDIRVNHLKVRRGEVVGDLKLCKVGELTAEDFAKHKSDINSVADAITFLSNTYAQPVDTDTVITVVYYKNHPLIAEEIEQADAPNDPHMVS